MPFFRGCYISYAELQDLRDQRFADIDTYNNYMHGSFGSSVDRDSAIEAGKRLGTIPIQYGGRYYYRDRYK